MIYIDYNQYAKLDPTGDAVYNFGPWKAVELYRADLYETKEVAESYLPQIRKTYPNAVVKTLIHG